MADLDAHSEVIDAPAEKILGVLTDFEHYPEWQSGVVACTVKERDEAGRGSLVELRYDARITKIRYTARYWYDLPAGRLGFDLVEGDLKACSGRYGLDPLDGTRTRVSIDVRTEVGFYIPGPVKKLIRDQSVRASIRDLKRRVEG
jgi:ribosome-associated toxin RatA of RatAB toxin-antitoxin module